MKQRLFAAVISALVFVAGIVAGMWMERHRPLPPPPLPLGSEFIHGAPGRGGPYAWRNHPVNRAELIAQVQSLRPQLEAFQARMKAIDDEFDRGISQVLSPEERLHRAAKLKRHADESWSSKENGPALTDTQIISLLRDQPARTILWDVVIPFRLDYFTREYHLDDVQREKVRTLLKERRERVLELVDSSPPPSVMLGRLAPLIQRLAPPASPKAEPAP